MLREQLGEGSARELADLVGVEYRLLCRSFVVFLHEQAYLPANCLHYGAPVHRKVRRAGSAVSVKQLRAIQRRSVRVFR